MRNSVTFRQLLDQRCEEEKLWSANIESQLSWPAVQVEDNFRVYLGLKPVRFPPYNILKGKLDSAAGEISVLDGLSESSFSVSCIIEGCVNALLFEMDRDKKLKIEKTIRKCRDKHILKKNKARAESQANERAFAAFCLNPSIANTARLYRLGKASRGQVGETHVNLEMHKFGCALYQQPPPAPKRHNTSRLSSPKHPGTASLLALNLEYLFRHWPVTESTLPTMYPKKQKRGHRPEILPSRPPRRDITAYFVSALFPQADTVYDADQIKNLLNKMKKANARFCGW